MKTNTFKSDLFNQFARVGKALSNANRLELLEFLAQGSRSVESLANVAKLSIANTSQHLQHFLYCCNHQEPAMSPPAPKKATETRQRRLRVTQKLFSFVYLYYVVATAYAE